MKQCLLQNEKKEDLLPAGKAIGQTKLSFAKKEQNYWRGKLIISFCTQIISKAIFFSSSQIDVIAWNTPKSGFSLIRTFLYIIRIVSAFFRIWTKFTIHGKIRIRFCLYTEKYGPEKGCYSTYFTQWAP